jgi:CHAD domain-containing protein
MLQQTAVTLEFDLPAPDWPRLLRLPPVRAGRAGRVQASPCRIVWHDTPDGALAARSCALSESREGWRLERIWPDGPGWPPANPPPLLASDGDLAALAPELSRLDATEGLMPLAAFEGTRRSLRLDPPERPGEAIDIVLLDGVLRTVAAEQPACLCRLSGPPAPVQALALALADSLALRVPRHSLAARGRALARGEAPPPRRLGAPGVAPGATVGEALAGIIEHLTDAILHWLPLVATEDAEQAVHQTRVAVRRLRSALSLFARALPEGTLAEASHRLRELASRLGPARDWDVFLAGTAAELAAGFPQEPRMAALLAAGARRRGAVHAGLREWLRRPAVRRLEVELACFAALRPWQTAALAAEQKLPVEVLAGDAMLPPEPPRDLLGEPARDYARRMLGRRYKRMLHDGAGLAELSVPALHELRKDGKRLRYACEFFAPLFPGRATRRFLRQMEPLQEALGHLNDAAAAAGLMAELGTGPARAFAAGAVQGFIAGSGMRLRHRIEAAWNEFRDGGTFWD